MTREFVLAFCQWVVGLLFLYSSIGKVRDIWSFQESIYRFRILPNLLIKPFSFAVIAAEFLIVLLMITGSVFVRYGFMLGGLLLLLFTIAFGAVLIRGISTTCNCFGTSSTVISWIDVFRNITFILIALSGLILSLEFSGPYSNLSIVEIGVSGIIALAFTLVFANLGEIAQLLHIKTL